MFAVDDIDDTLNWLREHGARSSSARWSSTKRRIGSATSAGPEGLLIGLAQELG
jgi:hypothetical protein